MWTLWVLNELWRDFPADAGAWFWQVCHQIALCGHEPAQLKLALIYAFISEGTSCTASELICP